jgi:hypothetical protein
MGAFHRSVSPGTQFFFSQLTGRLVLFLVYFPRHLKYQQTVAFPAPTAYGTAGQEDGDGSAPKAKVTTTPEWRLATTLAAVVALHL